MVRELLVLRNITAGLLYIVRTGLQQSNMQNKRTETVDMKILRLDAAYILYNNKHKRYTITKYI
jgi:hypothetical protein